VSKTNYRQILETIKTTEWDIVENKQYNKIKRWQSYTRSTYKEVLNIHMKYLEYGQRKDWNNNLIESYIVKGP
jgi:hypothetical protein